MSNQHPSNNFDFVRLFAAALVLYSHQFPLSGRVEPRLFDLLHVGTFGVLIFFSVSGYLVMQSWDRDPHLLRFVAKRFMRIWPGLMVVTGVAALIVGPIVTTVPLGEYFHSPVTRDYFSMLYLNIKFLLPGVFEQNPWPIVNGALWTIPIEVHWYGFLLIAGVCGLLRNRTRHWLLAGVLVYAIYVYLVFDVQHNPKAAFPLPAYGAEYGTYFSAGVALYFFRDSWRRFPFRLLGPLAVCSAALAWLGYGYAAFYVVLPLLVIWFGTASTPVVRRFGRFGDFSYGIYIYAFMTQQLLLSITGTHHPFWPGLLASAVGALVFAILSWHLVERPALSLKRRLPGAGTDTSIEPAQAGVAHPLLLPEYLAGEVSPAADERHS